MLERLHYYLIAIVTLKIVLRFYMQRFQQTKCTTKFCLYSKGNISMQCSQINSLADKKSFFLDAKDVSTAFT